ncbi:MAG: YibE/F family protein [Spirochaetales bacterium]|nr:YibE/F family protein [Spirochaetales bacterium]
MLVFRTKIERKDLLFVGLLAALTALLFFLPTGFERQVAPNAVRARALVIETDDSGVSQYGIVKAGDQAVRIRIENGRFKGRELEAGNMLLGKMELDKMFAPEDRALVVLDLDPDSGEILYANLIDHYRINLEILLLALFALLLLLFAGWTGLKALLSFVFTALVIWKLMLPAILDGWDPVWIALGVVTVLTAAVIFLVGGLTRKGLVAFLGAVGGVAITCLLSVVFGRAFHLHGAVRPFSETLLYSGFPHLDLRKIFLAGVFLASSGAVMDLAMDVSASMNEVTQHNPAIPRLRLIASGFAVGRSVIGTMTTTLLLAYSGGYTAMLLVFLAQGTPILNVLNITYVSAEILHTLVGSFGLVLVAPLTAVLGGAMLASRETRAKVPAGVPLAGLQGASHD